MFTYHPELLLRVINDRGAPAQAPNGPHCAPVGASARCCEMLRDAARGRSAVVSADRSKTLKVPANNARCGQRRSVRTRETLKITGKTKRRANRGLRSVHFGGL